MLRVVVRSRVFLSICSGLLLALPFCNGSLWVFAWFSFLPLFLALSGTSKTKAFLLATLTGLIFWSIAIYWLIYVTLPGAVVLVMYLALYCGLFGLIFQSFNKYASVMSMFFLAAVWVVLEYCRSYFLTGFPWALLGYSQYRVLPVIQFADITGAWGVSYLVMLGNIAFASLLHHKHDHRTRITAPATGFLIIVAVVCVYGYYQLRTNFSSGEKLRASVIQANIAQELKWDQGAQDFIIEKYTRLTREAAEEKPDLLVWPEAASPGIMGEDRDIFMRIPELASDVHIPLLLGAVVRQDDNFYNSALLIDGAGSIANRYDKLHLVPFGEYIPLKKYFPFLATVVPIGDITRGKEYTIFDLKGKKFAVLICFEDVFPQLAREFTRRGAQFLVNVTNDAWYMDTWAAQQHFQASVFRAIENRRPLVRSANTGISGFIDPTGDVSLVADSRGRNVFISGFRSQLVMLAPRKKLSIYSLYGDTCMGLVILLIGIIFYVQTHTSGYSNSRRGLYRQ